MSESTDVVRRLELLHEEYAQRVNLAVGEDRDDLVWELADAHADAALRVITSAGGPA